jgi:GNAT superfamily N-acetyltransferase
LTSIHLVCFDIGVPGFEEMEANLRATLTMFTRAKPSGEARELPGLALACSGVNFSMFNSATLTSPVQSQTELEQRIGASTAYFQSKGLPWSFWICQHRIADGLRPELVRIFGGSGLHLVVDLPGMAAERLNPPLRPLPALDCRRVIGPRTRAEFNQIMSSTFGIAFRISREIYEAEDTWAGNFTGYVGYIGETPIATAATLTTDGVTGVYAVATLPQYRRSGYAEAIVRHALAQASDGPTILQSSDAGYRLYEQMGYRTVTRYAVFAYS